jgi:hypothetical protein
MDVKSCPKVLASVQIFLGCSLGNLAPFLLFRPSGFGAIKKVNTSDHWIRVVLGT